MFSQLSVCPQGGGCLPHCILGYTPPGPEADTLLGRHHTTPPNLDRHSPGQKPPWVETPRADTHPWTDTPCLVHAGIYTIPLPSTCWDTQTPPVQCMLGCGQQAGGTYPTGMHSCSFCADTADSLQTLQKSHAGFRHKNDADLHTTLCTHLKCTRVQVVDSTINEVYV